MRVQNWYHRRRIVDTRDSEGWSALDEELNDGEREGSCPIISLLFGLRAVRVSSLLLQVIDRHTPTYF